MHPLASRALEPSTPLGSYGRQAWVMENGLPQNTVLAVVQTRDGFIWLATEVGLVRFDGASFQTFDRNTAPALPGNDVRCLLTTADGALWIGTGDGLLRWSNGRAVLFTTIDGLPANRIERLEENRDGRVQVETSAGVGWIYGDRWSGDTAGKLEPPGMRTSSELDISGGVGISAVATKNVVEIYRGTDRVSELTVGKDLPGSKIQALFADREGALWIGSNGGLTRWLDDSVQRFPMTDALGAASVLGIAEDREGNIWVGTETDGLQILRDLRFHTFTVRDGLLSDATTTVVEDVAGMLWVGTSGSGLNAIARDAKAVKRSYTVRNGLASDVILSLAAAANGDLWVGTPDGLNRIRAGSVSVFTSADGLPDDFIRSLLVDGDGSLWIGTRHGLTHWANLSDSGAAVKKETLTRANGLGSDLVGAMARDSRGDLWVATLAGLSRLHGATIENFTMANGLSSNVITALLVRKDKTLMIGTQDHGWDVWDGKRFTKARSPTTDRSETSIHAMLEDQNEHVWFATGNGIARGECSKNSAGANGKSDDGCTEWVEFGTADGLRSRETATNSHPSAYRSRDGRLWFATPKGLVEVDPAHFAVNKIAPPVALERFVIDDANEPVQATNSIVKIPAGHVHFEFDYAGLSFVAPQKVRYRYKLEGFDRDWTEAGARRTAYYTNIPAGTYTFRVQAANNDGLWNTDGASLAFELRPHYYQTLWFYALLLVLAVVTVLLLQRLRLARVQREFNAVLGERSRIAREIHDTLAQGYVGISVQLEVLSELLRMSKIEAAAKQLDVTRGYVREGLADARQSIWALRSQDDGETTLPVKLRRMVEAASDTSLDSRLNVFGAYRPLAAETEREILRVAQEGIHNVKKHAGATQLTVQLEYQPNEVALDMRDDGRGFVIDKAALPGHYGLIGMRERAAAIGGKLEVTSAPGMGTTVRLCVAAKREI